MSVDGKGGYGKRVADMKLNKASLTRSSILRLLNDFECICDHLSEASCRTAHHAHVRCVGPMRKKYQLRD